MEQTLTVFSVSHASQSKEYPWLLPSHGVEMGFGAAGEYEAHAHRHFVDVIYSPAGLRLSPGEEQSNLAVVRPRTTFGPTVTSAFFFLKFLPAPGDYVVPEKVIGAALSAFPRVPTPATFSVPFAVDLDHFDPRDSSRHQIGLTSVGEALHVSSTAGWNLTILP